MPGASYDTYDAVEQKFSIQKFQPSTDLKEAAVGKKTKILSYEFGL